MYINLNPIHTTKTHCTTHEKHYTVNGHSWRPLGPLRHTSIRSCQRVSVERGFVDACLSRPSPPSAHQHHALYKLAHSFSYC